MNQKRFALLSIVWWSQLAAAGAWAPATAGAPGPSAPLGEPATGISLPIVFEENRGQTAQAVRFLARAPGYTLLISTEELIFALPARAPEPGPALGPVGSRARLRTAQHPAPVPASLIRFRFSGSNASPEVRGVDPLPGHAHYLRGGSPDEWVRNVPTFAEVVVQNLYPDIDLRLYSRDGKLEYDLVLAPGADLSAVEIVVEGAENVTLRDDGGLSFVAGHGVLLQQAPEVYEVKEGRAFALEASYRALDGGRFGFEVLEHDPAAHLVIDPVLTYSSYLGGDGTDLLYGPRFDPAGNLYLHGYTSSVKIPALPVSAPRNHSFFEWDAFLVQLGASGRTVLSWLYIGGEGTEILGGFEFDADGNLLLAGTTDARDFPFRGHVRQPFAGAQDVFLVKLDPRSGEILYATLFGGLSDEWVSTLAVDRWGAAYLVGGTLSSDLPTSGGSQPAAGGDLDCFVAKFRAEDGHRLAATYFGGFSTEFCDASVVTPSGEIYLAGEVIDGGLPVTPRAFQRTYGGHTRDYIGDAFVAKLDRTLKLVYASYLGGPHDEYALGLAVDPDGNAYVTGISFGAGFPLVKPLRRTRGLGAMAFVSKVNPSGSRLLFSTYLGGNLAQYGTHLAYDPRWGLIVVGLTGSPDFPVRDPVQGEIGFDPEDTTLGGYPYADVFVTVLAPRGNEIRFSTFLGGTSDDFPRGLSVDPRGNLWITGIASSAGFPVVNALQPSQTQSSDGFLRDAFLAKIEPGDPQFAPRYITSPEFPDHRFAVRFLRPDGSALDGTEAASCPAETLCVAGALLGRTEVMLRIAGPKPNGRAWPHLVKFSTAEIWVLVEQLSTGETRTYRLAGASPGDDRLAGLFDRQGFVPQSPAWTFGGHVFGLKADTVPLPPGGEFASEHFPNFRFRARISAGGESQVVRQEKECIEETLCLSGAVPGRSEVFVRVVGPKPNGRLWPTIVKLTTSTVELWIEQISTGDTKYYRIEGAAPGRDDLTGLFDRTGFAP